MKHNWCNTALFLALAGTTALCFVVRNRDVRLPNYEFLPKAQMAQSPAYHSFSPNDNFADQLTLRTPPAGTLARGHMPLHYQPTLQDAQRAGEELHLPNGWLDDADHLERGNAVFDNFCQVCHGPLGQGNGPVTLRGFPPPASLLADRAVQMKDGQMFHVLTYGQANMPSFAAQLSQDDRWNVIVHVRTLQQPYGPQTAPTRSQQVAKLFRENCSACHGLDGTGSTIRKALPLIPDFTSLAWQMSQTELAIVNQISYGSHPLMPAFRYKLPQDQILGLAVYVRSFAAQQPGGQIVTAPPTSHITAKQVFGTYCFACHDTTGKGIAAMRASMPELPDFTSAAWQKSRTDVDLSHSILQGKGKFMLPMKDKLGTVDVKQMVELVRGFEGGKQVIELEPPKGPGPVLPGPVAAGSGSGSGTGSGEIVPPTPDDTGAKIRVGATIFQQYCIVCHGPDGTGSLMRPSMPQIPNFTLAGFHLTHSDGQIQESILNGKGALMPANRSRVTSAQADALVAYVRAFGPKGITPPSGGAISDSDFDKAYHRLQEQWNELQKQLKKAKEDK